MEVRTELNSYQRELLMRMYRSRLNEEVFPVSFDMRGVGEALIRCGLIVAVNGFYEFTEHGLKAWKAYGDNLNAVRHFHELKQQQKRKAEVERKKMAKEISLSDWEKQARENLNAKQVDVLRTLYEAGADTVWVQADIHHITRDTLVRYGYIEYDKHNQKYWLLDEGVQKLAQYPAESNGAPPKPEEVVKSRVKPFHDGAGLDNEDSLPTPNPSPLHGEGNEVDALEHCDTCAGCVDHEVLHMLAEKFPAIARLRQTVLETRRLMDELGIEKK